MLYGSVFTMLKFLDYMMKPVNDSYYSNSIGFWWKINNSYVSLRHCYYTRQWFGNLKIHLEWGRKLKNFKTDKETIAWRWSYNHIMIKYNMFCDYMTSSVYNLDSNWWWTMSKRIWAKVWQIDLSIIKSYSSR